MCGFAGYINTYGTFDREEVIHAMADRIIHRGPDDGHYYVDEDISLGFRRLSIIDLEGGRQPILNEDGNLVLLFLQFHSKSCFLLFLQSRNNRMFFLLSFYQN